MIETNSEIQPGFYPTLQLPLPTPSQTNELSGRIGSVRLQGTLSVNTVSQYQSKGEKANLKQSLDRP